MKTGELLFIDSNVLVAFLDKMHPAHTQTVEKYRQWRTLNVQFAFSPQVIGELFRTLTSPVYSKAPMTASTFQVLVRGVLDNPRARIFCPSRAAIDLAIQSAVDRNLSSSRIFDLLLYGTMREHGIKKLATYNMKHFAGLDGIELVPVV